MYIKDRIKKVIFSNNRSTLADLERDSNMILDYFGYGDEKLPTFINISEKYNTSRQRVEQIVSRKFKNHVTEADLYEMKIISSILNEKEIWFGSDFIETLISNEIINDIPSVAGLLNLIGSFNIATDYSIYNFEIKKATKKEYLKNEDILITKKETAKDWRSIIKTIRTIPGMIGIANLNNVFQVESKFSSIDLNFVKRIISQSKNSWTYRDDENDFWYLFEDADNTIFNKLEKLKKITDSVDFKILSETLLNSLYFRTSRYQFPNIQIVKTYLNHNKYTTVEDELLYLDNLIPAESLNEIENDIIDIFSKVDGCLYFPDLYNPLIASGYSDAYIKKTCFNSIFLYIDKTDGRAHYKYYLISKFKKIEKGGKKDTASSDYQKYRKLLIELYNNTDIDIQSRRRAEQSILRNYLFAGRKTRKCAICGNEINISALVCAHKKKRKDCSENERIDPNIVMPVCIYGCDYLYENRFVTIDKDKIRASINDGLSEYEKSVVNSLNGNRIEDEWLRGDIDYFKD